VDRDAYATALEAELVYAEAAKVRAERRISNIKAELRRIRGDAPETVTPADDVERAVPPKPRRG
jgi:hypothetical protein